jgi:hypothetical protein
MLVPAAPRMQLQGAGYTSLLTSTSCCQVVCNLPTAVNAMRVHPSDMASEYFASKQSPRGAA